MKSIFLSSFLFITLIACAIENKQNSPESEQTKIIEQIKEVDQEIINSMPDSLTETGDALRINYDSAEKSLREIEPVILTEEKPSVEKPIEKKEIDKVLKTETKEKIETTPVVTEPVIEKTPKPTPQVKAEIHKTWDDLLRKHVSSSGKVNYSGFVNEKAELTKYIKELQSLYKDVDSWGKNKRLAYWINVYNAVTVQLITDNHPVKTIKELKGGKPWDTKLIDLGGVSYTLNVIENKIIRPKYDEPRIHFAVNCAAKSCPKIMNKAWTEDNISRYLTKQTKAFVANTNENSISADKIELSKIFDWYKEDFGGDNAKLIEFLNKYSATKINPDAEVRFKDYNWDLNN
ncbi:MAG: DUF547 domain-containing protein [Flavobacteriales bacterium]